MKKKQKKQWESYEEVAAYLLNQMASAFGLDSVEGKQKVLGLRSSTPHEIDAKGVLDGGEAFVIIECRRNTTSKQSQEKLDALAYRILDTGAKGGILVSHLGMQKGAAKIAHAENIINVHMDQNSTRLDFIVGFLNQIFLGTHDDIHVVESVNVVVCKPETHEPPHHQQM